MPNPRPIKGLTDSRIQNPIHMPILREIMTWRVTMARIIASTGGKIDIQLGSYMSLAS
jgi:hypothetical protein